MGDGVAGGSGTGGRGRPGRARACPASPGGGPRDPRLAGFAKGGEWDACPPSAALAAALEAASGPEWRCPGASRDELVGLLRQWQALESWAAAGKLGVLRALIRDDDQPLPGGGYHGDLPEGWTKSLTHEVALALSMPAVSAERLMWLAWNLRALLPGTGDLLAAGTLTLAKARAVDKALNLLSAQDAAKAEAMILPELPGKTYGQVQSSPPGRAHRRPGAGDPPPAGRRAAQVPGDLVPRGVRRGGAVRPGPAHRPGPGRARQRLRPRPGYKDSGAFPDEARMDQYRAAAYLDLLNGDPADARIATGQLRDRIRPTPAPTGAGRRR